MKNPSTPTAREVSEESAPPSTQTREFHTLQDLPDSVARVSSGPLGWVARRDHSSWKSKDMTDPARWAGWLDCSLGKCLEKRPLPRIALCVGIGALAGMLFGRR
ncbi:MAG: hypothetical protein V4689_22515 [Verrucomicrobiota bacterium]